MDWLHVLLAGLAGGGWCLAWGYRTSLYVALGRTQAAPERTPQRPPPHPEPDDTEPQSTVWGARRIGGGGPP